MGSGDGGDGIQSGGGDVDEYTLDESVDEDIGEPVGVGPLIVDLAESEPLCGADLLEPILMPE